MVRCRSCHLDSSRDRGLSYLCSCNDLPTPSRAYRSRSLVGRLRTTKRSGDTNRNSTGITQSSIPLENRPIINDRGIMNQVFHRLEDSLAGDLRIIVTTNISVNGDIERGS